VRPYFKVWYRLPIYVWTALLIWATTSKFHCSRFVLNKPVIKHPTERRWKLVFQISSATTCTNIWPNRTPKDVLYTLRSRLISLKRTASWSSQATHLQPENYCPNYLTH
jgi:hypothetical protein